MLVAGADPNAAGQFPLALHVAIERGSPDVVAALLAGGADVKQANPQGQDALALARIRAERGRKSSSGQTPYIGEWKDAPDAGKQIVELVSEHVGR